MDTTLITWDRHPRELGADPAATIALDRVQWEARGARFEDYEDDIGGTTAIATGAVEVRDETVEMGVVDHGEPTTYLLVSGSFRDHSDLAREVIGTLEAGGIVARTDVLELLSAEQAVEPAGEPDPAPATVLPADTSPAGLAATSTPAPRRSLAIGDVAPDFEAQTSQGPVSFHDWLGDSWGVLFSHPRDFTPVCTTELGYMASIKPEFDKRNTKIIGLSADSIANHERWSEDIVIATGNAPNYPLIADHDLKVARAYGMLPAEVDGEPSKRTPADNQTVRNVFVIGPDKKIKLILVYPMTTGRNFDEVLRVLDSLQLTAKHRVTTPAQWQLGDDVIISGAVSNEEARELFGEWESPLPYIRIVPQTTGPGPS